MHTDGKELTVHAVAGTTGALPRPSAWDPRRAAAAVRDRWERTLPGSYPEHLLSDRAQSMVHAFEAAIGRQGESLHSVATGGWVDIERVAAEISILADWRGLPSDPYDYEDARDVTRTLLQHLREPALPS